MGKHKKYHNRIIKTRERHTATSGGMKNAKRLSQRKTLLERNVYKRELEQTKNNTHKQARKKANICKEKKKQWLNNRIKQIEEAHKQNYTRKFFKDIQTF